MYGVIELAVAAMLMRVGVSLYTAGMSRSKNAASAAMRSVLDFAVAALGFWALGAGVRFGFRWCLGGEWGGAPDGDPRVLATLCAVLMGTGLAAGAIGERSRLRFSATLSLLLAVIVLPLTARISRAAGPMAGAGPGWLGGLGYTDVAGAAFLFMACGVCGAVAAVVVGPRQGKFNRDGSSSAIPGHNLSLATAGALLMVAAVVPFVAGAYRVNMPMQYVPPVDLEARSVANVLLAAAAGALGGLLYGRLRFGKAEVLLTYGGLLGGAIAAAAGGPVIGGSAAIVTGAVAGVLAAWAVLAMDLRARIDDVAGIAAVAITGGACGAVAVGIFGPADTVAERVRHVMVQVGGTTAIAAIAAVTAAVILVAAKKTLGARSPEADEFDGLDLAEHDINAYPDFQQTMIKSYHLREA